MALSIRQLTIFRTKNSTYEIIPVGQIPAGDPRLFNPIEQHGARLAMRTDSRAFPEYLRHGWIPIAEVERRRDGRLVLRFTEGDQRASAYELPRQSTTTPVVEDEGRAVSAAHGSVAPAASAECAAK